MEQVASALVRLTRMLRRSGTELPGTLSTTSVTTLSELERGGPRRITELAAHERVSQPAMTQLITRLQRSGLVERTTDPQDRRVVRISLTEAGRTALAERRSGHAARLAALQRQLSPAHREALRAAAPALEALSLLAPDPDRTGPPEPRT